MLFSDPKIRNLCFEKMLPNFGYDVGFTGTGSFKNKCHISSQNQKKCLDFYNDNNNNKYVQLFSKRFSTLIIIIITLLFKLFSKQFSTLIIIIINMFSCFQNGFQH